MNPSNQPSGQPPDASESQYAYETILKCRDLELDLHVARSNLCLVVEGALMAFVAPALLSLTPESPLSSKTVPILIALFGIALSAISVSVVKGANFWVSYWEHRLGELEVNVLPTIPIFRDHPSASNVKLLRRLPKRLKYVSSRKAMLRLFRFLTAVWVALLIFVLWT